VANGTTLSTDRKSMLEIRTASLAQHAAMLALVDAEIRTDVTATCAWDDFPLVLASENRDWQFVAIEGEEVVGCLACLIRPFTTSCGIISVAGIGSVVTTARWRGRGISSRLQRFALERIAASEVPLAVLWTDRPEYYAGCGFGAAGVEYHVDYEDCDLNDLLVTGGQIRPYQDQDTAQVAALYARHPLRTVRAPGDAESLYGMPGTRGLVFVEGQQLRGYLFAGKGADFPDYVTEFGGDSEAVVVLLAEARRRQIATKVLVPQGATALQRLLVARGARWSARPSGYWSVVAADVLRATVSTAASTVARWPDSNDAAAWLGSVDRTGTPHAGALQLAVWGFDSV
jgi:predicted N-acetyltransferase YhbS